MLIRPFVESERLTPQLPVVRCLSEYFCEAGTPEPRFEDPAAVIIVAKESDPHIALRLPFERPVKLTLTRRYLPREVVDLRDDILMLDVFDVRHDAITFR